MWVINLENQNRTGNSSARHRDREEAPVSVTGAYIQQPSITYQTRTQSQNGIQKIQLVIVCMEWLLQDPHNYLLNSLKLAAHAAPYYVVVGSLIIMSEKMEVESNIIRYA